MSFSEYNGSKSKVSTAVGRILRNAQENLPKLPNTQGSSLSSLLKSISSSNSSSERLSKQSSHSTSSTTTSTSPFSSTTSKFGFQKLRLGSGEKKRGTNQHAELLDNQQGQEDTDGEDDEDDAGGRYAPLSKCALVNNPTSPGTQKQKKWRF